MLLLFPTFPMRFPDFNIASIQGLDAIYQKWIDRAREFIPLDLELLDKSDNSKVPFHKVTEQAHYACVIENISVAEWVTAKFGVCSHACSYSMGLFSALIFSEALDFASTLKLVQEICNLTYKASKDTSWSAGAVIQFPLEGLKEIISEIDQSLEITDIYGPHTILFTGKFNSVKTVLDRCLKEGASATRMIPLTAPFHTTILKKVSPDLDRLIDGLSIKSPKWPILSSINQNWLTTPNDVQIELRKNVWAPMNWQLTMEKFVNLNDELIIECGASFNLSELARPALGPKKRCLDFRDFSNL